MRSLIIILLFSQVISQDIAQKMIDNGDYENADGVVENTWTEMEDFKFGIGFESKGFESDLRFNYTATNLGIPHEEEEHDDHEEDDHGEEDHGDEDHGDEDHDDDHSDEGHAEMATSYYNSEETVTSYGLQIARSFSDELAATLNRIVTNAKINGKSSYFTAHVITQSEFVCTDRVHKRF